MAPDVPGAVFALITAFPQIEAIRAVAHYEAAEAVPHLILLLRHDEPAVRWNAARSLGKLRVAAAVPDLVAALTDDQAAVREHAAEALGEIGPAAAEAVPALIMALSDPDCRVRRDAVRSLGQIGPAAKSALSAVEARSRGDDDVAVRAAAERALRLIDPGHSDSGDKK
jgi:HEAT repeat protein